MNKPSDWRPRQARLVREGCGADTTRPRRVAWPPVRPRLGNRKASMGCGWIPPVRQIRATEENDLPHYALLNRLDRCLAPRYSGRFPLSATAGVVTPRAVGMYLKSTVTSEFSAATRRCRTVSSGTRLTSVVRAGPFRSPARHSLISAVPTELPAVADAPISSGRRSGPRLHASGGFRVCCRRGDFGDRCVLHAQYRITPGWISAMRFPAHGLPVTARQDPRAMPLTDDRQTVRLRLRHDSASLYSVVFYGSGA